MSRDIPEVLSYFIRKDIISPNPGKLHFFQNVIHFFTNIVMLLDRQRDTNMGPEGPITERTAVMTNQPLK